jgi:hypothetical protein
MNKLIGVTGAVVAVKAVTGLAIVAAAAAVATEITITGNINPAAWGRPVSHQVTLAAQPSQAVSEAPRAGSVSGADRSGTALPTGDAGRQAGPNGSGANQNKGTVSPPKVTTDPEPSDLPMAAVQAKFIPKP